MEKIKESRGLSFFVLFVIYVLATVVGIVVYRVLPYDFWLNLLIADTAATVFTFIFSLIFKNASVYDPYWSVQPLVILAYAATTCEKTAAKWILLCVVFLWGIRLTANWAYTFHGLVHQDWRYTKLHDTTGVWYPIINFVGIHMVPTLIVYAVTLPAVWLFVYGGSGGIQPLFIVCCAVSVCAFTVQGIADVEMHKFRKNRTGTFIRTGLWEHSRHPNYLGEIMMWWGVGGAAVSLMPENVWLLAGALSNTILFLAVSIPLAEGKQKKKPGYAEYKAETRALLPIPKRKK